MLALLMGKNSGISVAGTHGKTTTSALIANIYLKAGINPTIVIGGHLKNIQSNAHYGTRDTFIVEADESDRSFLQLNPVLSAITNIDLDHLETYKSLDDIIETFNTFIQKTLSNNGRVIACIDDKNIRNLGIAKHKNCLTYGFSPDAFVRAENILLYPTHSTCTIIIDKKTLDTISIPLPGMHNIQNALAAVVAALLCKKITLRDVKEGIETFAGVDRRFTQRGTYKGARIFDDYGHHPEEIKYLLETAAMTSNNVTVIFQPHRYTRTKALWNDFVSLFAQNPHVKHLIITDVYPAGEQPIEQINCERLVQEINANNPSYPVEYATFDNIVSVVQKQKFSQNDIILTVGAGSITAIGPMLTQS